MAKIPNNAFVVFILLFSISLSGRRTTEQKEARTRRPPPVAPRSACAENAPSRARLGARSVGPLHIENSRFSGETVAGATLNLFASVYIVARYDPFLIENDTFGKAQPPDGVAHRQNCCDILSA